MLSLGFVGYGDGGDVLGVGFAFAVVLSSVYSCS